MDATVHHLTPVPSERAEKYWPESEVWKLVEAVMEGTADAARRRYEAQPSAQVLTLVKS